MVGMIPNDIDALAGMLPCLADSIAAVEREGLNVFYVMLTVDEAKALLAAARERDALREALEQIANGTTVVLANEHERPTCLAGKASQALARAALATREGE